MHAYSLRSISASLSVVSVTFYLANPNPNFSYKIVLHGSLHAQLYQHNCLEIENIGIWDITVVSELFSWPAVGLRDEK